MFCHCFEAFLATILLVFSNFFGIFLSNDKYASGRLRRRWGNSLEKQSAAPAPPSQRTGIILLIWGREISQVPHLRVAVVKKAGTKPETPGKIGKNVVDPLGRGDRTLDQKTQKDSKPGLLSTRPPLHIFTSYFRGSRFDGRFCRF